MADPRYPAGYPLPQRDPYTYNVDMGVARYAMENGSPRQRRVYFAMPHYFQLTFIVPRTSLNAWQKWVNDNAYNWFELPLVNIITIGQTMCANYCSCRFMSDLAVSVLTKENFRIAVEAELKPGQSNTNPGVLPWIIGGTPATPSPEWVIGGTPANPSPNWVVQSFF